MAGRPLRHARLACRNPLVGYDNYDTPDLKRQNLDRAVRLTRASGAEALFRESYKNVPLNIRIQLVTGTPDHTFGRPRKGMPPVEPGELVLIVSDWVPSSMTGKPQGHVARFSALTPFTVLHRLGDILQGKLFGLGKLLTQEGSYGQQFGVAPYRRLLSPGVDTWAGRHNALGTSVDVVSDVFAKYLLTGRLAYDPDAPPPSGDPWTKQELRFRRQLLLRMEEVIPLLLAEAQKGGVYEVQG